MNGSRLFLSRLHYPVRTLGPGARIGIWFQGCSIRCPGCISMDTWAPGRHPTTVGDVMMALASRLDQADGITISGGEPFDQPDALKALLAGLRQHHGGDILVYSGYPAESLDLDSYAGLIDALIFDPFDLSAPQTLTLRGSDNQRLIPLTAKGLARFGPLVGAPQDPAPGLDIMFDDYSGEVFLAGIPRRGDMDRLAALMREAGHRIVTSEDSRPPR